MYLMQAVVAYYILIKKAGTKSLIRQIIIVNKFPYFPSFFP